jgi:glutaredoxin
MLIFAFINKNKTMQKHCKNNKIKTLFSIIIILKIMFFHKDNQLKMLRLYKKSIKRNKVPQLYLS